MCKYPISKEFLPYSLFTPPMNRPFVKLAQWAMKTPRFLWQNPALAVETHLVPVGQGAEIELYLLTPRGLATPAPCLVNYHGGGFVFEGSGSHFRLAMAYALEARCKVAYVRYRLAPAHPFPTPQEDAYAALCWLHANAQRLGIDPLRMGIAGDSAGGTLTAVVCQMARDRGAAVKPLFQLLVYPWLDGRNQSESHRRFTDTPMWNSTLSRKVGPLINPDPAATPPAYRSPVEAESLAGLPPAYIEVAQFDCLHDDGVLYARQLQQAGVEAVLHRVPGTMHGFDVVASAPTSKAMLLHRTAYMRNRFAQEHMV